MQFNTVEDVIRFAVRKEEASTQFYTELARQMEDPAARIIFEVLSRKEMEHHSNLELELMKLGKTVHEQSYNVSNGQDSFLILDDEARKMNFISALQLAIRKERTSFLLFTELVAQTTDLELRQFFLELAEEEMRHLIQLENEYNSIIPARK